MWFVQSEDEQTPEPQPDADPSPPRWSRTRAGGRRFVERYERRREERLRGEHHPLQRPIRVTAGVVLIIGGVAIGWLPGPGFVILAFPGALLVASEWRRAALLMDRVEREAIPRIYRLRARLRGGPKPEWVEQAPELWAIWCERRGTGAVDTGQRRRRADESDAGAEAGRPG